MIRQPAAFNALCRNLRQGLNVTTVDELVQYALVGLDSVQVSEIRLFLDGILLKDGYSAEELRKWWWTTSATITFADGKGVRVFLTALRSALDKPPYHN